MGDYTPNQENLKAVLASDLSDGAKLAAIATLVADAKTAAEIAAALNKPLRTVERHCAELKKAKSAGTQICGSTQNCGTQNCGDTQICVPEHANLRTEDTQICVSEPHAHASITTRATKELPSEVSSYEVDSTPLIGPPPASKAPSRHRGTRLAADWQLPDDWRQWARLNFAHADDTIVSAEAEQFRDFWIAKSGANATKLDWQATWRNWCRNSKTLGRSPTPKPFNTGRMAYDEAKAARMANLRQIAARYATQ